MYNNRMTQHQTSTPVPAILDAAAGCYIQTGIEKTGMREVAQAAGVARSTLYRYFASRDDVLVSVIHREMLSMAGDMRQAKVHVSVMGDETQQNLSLRGLQNASGFLQQRVAQRVDSRYTPRLTFVLDQGLKNALEVNRILDDVLPAKPNETDNTQPTDPTDTD